MRWEMLEVKFMSSFLSVELEVSTKAKIETFLRENIWKQRFAAISKILRNDQGKLWNSLIIPLLLDIPDD